ncbi:MAG: HAMP domain-containing histidine kinase [Candidatus Delongbacteria bacterium]|nr:HAMP domain-containing histidine kinase [Candidatus Delongbacteria bacterium]MBN2833801.1 HAMP domain-containing histidine kinase [Candidatus Delongbacteria bacterium]
MIDNIELSDEEIIRLFASRIRERTQKVKEYEIVFKELEALNRKLIKSESNKSKFLSLIRNEFNNPLFAVIPLLKRIVESKLCNDSAISTIYTEILNLNFQLNNIIAVSEIENDILEKNFVKFEFKSILNDVISGLSYIYDDKNHNITINSNIENDIYFDREKFSLIISNLLDNSFCFSPPETEVSVRIHLNNSKFIVEIENNGDPITLGNPFESFEEENSYAREKKGLGLGLSIVKAYTEFLSGEISFDYIDSKNLVTLTFPEYIENGDEIFGFGLDDFDFAEDEEVDNKVL